MILLVLLLIGMHVYVNWDAHYSKLLPTEYQDKVRDAKEKAMSKFEEAKTKHKEKQELNKAKKEHMESFKEPAPKEEVDIPEVKAAEDLPKETK